MFLNRSEFNFKIFLAFSELLLKNKKYRNRFYY